MFNDTFFLFAITFFLVTCNFLEHLLVVNTLFAMTFQFLIVDNVCDLNVTYCLSVDDVHISRHTYCHVVDTV